MKRAKSASAGGEVSITYHPGRWNTIPPSTRWEPDFMSSFPTAGPKGRFQDGWKANQASQQHKGPAKSGPDTGLMTGGYCVDGREGRDSRPDRNASDAGINGCASHTGYTDHSFRERSICADIPRYVEPEHYSSTCCGKCKHCGSGEDGYGYVITDAAGNTVSPQIMETLAIPLSGRTEGTYK